MALKHNQYFFLHIPKTAGTSFRAMLHENFDPSEIYPSVANMRQEGRPYSNFNLIKKAKEKKYEQFKLINGHFPYSINSELNNPFTITFLRCPIERSLSNVFHFKSFIPKYKKMSPIKIVEKLPLIQTSNAYVRYLGTSLNINKEIKNVNLKEAEKNLSKINFIGNVKTYDRDLLQLSKKTGLTFKKTHTKNVNKTPYKVSKQLINKIIERNKFDLTLYHMFNFKSKFE